jgi:hypothetical protein
LRSSHHLSCFCESAHQTTTLSSTMAVRFATYFWLMSAFFCALQTGVRAQSASGHDNAIFVELLGHAGVFSFNYEHSPLAPISIAVGLGIIVQMENDSIAHRQSIVWYPDAVIQVRYSQALGGVNIEAGVGIFQHFTTAPPHVPLLGIDPLTIPIASIGLKRYDDRWGLLYGVSAVVWTNLERFRWSFGIQLGRFF